MSVVVEVWRECSSFEVSDGGRLRSIKPDHRTENVCSVALPSIGDSVACSDCIKSSFQLICRQCNARGSLSLSSGSSGAGGAVVTVSTKVASVNVIARASANEPRRLLLLLALVVVEEGVVMACCCFGGSIHNRVGGATESAMRTGRIEAP